MDRKEEGRKEWGERKRGREIDKDRKKERKKGCEGRTGEEDNDVDRKLRNYK